MMKFKRGSKVEVLNREAVPSSWCVAEIISGNGHTYSVRYESINSMVENDAIVERVSRKVIRPCPPLVQAVNNWKAGDVVEVFIGNSWKIATVLKVLGNDLYSVRPRGLIHKFKVKNGSIRMQLSWQDDKWVLIGTDSERSRDLKLTTYSQTLRFPVPQPNATINKQGCDCLTIQNDAGLPEPHMVSSRTLKRVSPYCSSLLDPYARKAMKFNAYEKEQRSQQFPARLLEKVDAVAYPRDTLGEKYMQPSFNNCSNGYYESEKRKSSGGVGECSLARLSDPNEFDIDECSVGSCSVLSESPNRFSRNPIAVTRRETDTLCSDAESFNVSREEEQISSPPLEEDLSTSIHRLELHAYRSSLEALYASGPLSWEKEALLTNLRISFHISNDEHLIRGHNWRHEPCFQRSKDDSALPFSWEKQWDNLCFQFCR